MFDTLLKSLGLRPRTPEEIAARQAAQAQRDADAAEYYRLQRLRHPPGVWMDSVSDEAMQNVLDH